MPDIDSSFQCRSQHGMNHEMLAFFQYSIDDEYACVGLASIGELSTPKVLKFIHLTMSPGLSHNNCSLERELCSSAVGPSIQVAHHCDKVGFVVILGSRHPVCLVEIYC